MLDYNMFPFSVSRELSNVSINKILMLTQDGVIVYGTKDPLSTSDNNLTLFRNITFELLGS